MSGKPDDIECANEIDLDDLLEIIQREGPVLTHGLDRVANSRTVDDDPQLAIAVGELNGLGNGILVSDVCCGKFHGSANCIERVPVGGRAVEGNHSCAGLDQRCHGCQSETRCASCHER